MAIIKLFKNKQKPSLLVKLRKAAIVVLVGFLFFSVISCLALRWLPPPTTAFMIYRHVEDLLENGSFRSINYRWVNASNISPYARAAAMAAEDQHFPEHLGFDFDAIGSSINKYQSGGKLRGASTISQQVAKNLFLTPTKSFLRKGLEVWFTLVIELFWSKERILEVYLNIAEFGDHVFGIEAASRVYFNIPARKLNRAQAALLAASLPNPHLLKVAQPSAYLLRRQHWILRQMAHLPDYKL